VTRARARTGIRARGQKFAFVATVAYLVALCLIVLALYFVGERWWVTSVGLYLPRLGFGLPLPFLVLAALALKDKRMLALQAAAFLVWLFPLMGLTYSFGSGPAEGKPSLRVMSYNVNSGLSSYEEVKKEIAARRPDVVLLQELFINPGDDYLKDTFPYVVLHTQFLLASRYPISTATLTEQPEFQKNLRSQPFVQRYVVDTPLGRIAFYNVHPVSPRHAFYSFRGAGIKKEVLTGNIFVGKGRTKMIAYGQTLFAQIDTVAELAGHESLPVVIAGDLNMPGLSPTWRRLSHAYQDGFSEAGSGFGYTFPNRDGWPSWLRLDRILSSAALRFTDFEIGCGKTSDHRCVVAELTQRE